MPACPRSSKTALNGAGRAPSITAAGIPSPLCRIQASGICHSECATGGNVFTLEEKLGGTAGEVYAIVGRNAPRQIVATYGYTDESGQLLFECVRYEPKDFRQRRPDGQRRMDLELVQGVRLVPYRLPQVIAADTVYVVEGEKDVATLERLGVVATCNPMGAGKWRSGYNAWFRDKRVIILPDQDEVGIAHGNNVARHLATVAASVRIVNVPEGKDVTEWSGTAEDLKQLC